MITGIVLFLCGIALSPLIPWSYKRFYADNDNNWDIIIISNIVTYIGAVTLLKMVARG